MKLLRDSPVTDETLIRRAFLGGRNKILDELGKRDNSHELAYEVVLALAADCLSGGNHLSENDTNHNILCFTGDLIRVVARQRQNQEKVLM